jgi:predicted MPP superfamily phosphohydrolase
MAWGILILFLFIFLLDVSVYHGIKRLFHLSRKQKSGKIFKIIYWLHVILFSLYAIIFIVIIKNSDQPDYIIYRRYFTLAGLFIAICFPKIFFALFFLIDLFFQFILSFFRKQKRAYNIKVFSAIGLALFSITFLIILHGIFFGKTNFKTEHITLSFKNLPESFDGLKIAQISDMHLGSFSDSLVVKKGIIRLMDEKPDIIFVTGDLINNLSEEARIMLPELKRLHAPYGVFSILGNHDVGDYRRWKTIKEKTEDFNNLITIEKEAGFTLLMNQNQIIKKGNDSIAIIGVESWGKPPFRKYGKLDVAIKGVEKVPFKILLTHNPTHWDVEVAGKNNADLTLSGHTHAMQFGINCCSIFWCPLKWMYPHWAGLYHNGEQYLYVNRGFGFLGFPGRIGMTPEITIIELKKIK